MATSTQSTLEPANTAPTVTISGPATIDWDSSATFTADASDPDVAVGDTLSYSWAIDDVAGSRTVDDGEGSTSTLSLSADEIEALGAGSHSASVTVTDGSGATGTDAHDFEVVEPPDTAPPTGPTLAPSPHGPGEWAPAVTATWSGATDPSGIDGYSLEWSQAALTTPDEVVDVQEDVASATSSGLADGAGYYFHLRARDNAGNWGSAVHLGPFNLDATAPAPTSPLSPTRVFQLNKRVAVTWGGSSDAASGVASYEVARSRARYSDAAFGPPVVHEVPSEETAKSFGDGISGYSYCFDVSARDGAGNAGASSGSPRCVSFPVGAASLTRSSGWRTRSGDGYYLGRYVESSTRGSTLTLAGVHGRRFALVATTCRGCGAVQVLWNGTPLKIASSNLIGLESGGVRKHRLFVFNARARVQSGTLKVKVVSSSGRAVRIEGVGVSKT